MFPNQIRGSGLAIAGLAQWGSNFLVTLTFPIILASAGLAFAYSLYTIGAVISIFFVIKYVYETKRTISHCIGLLGLILQSDAFISIYCKIH